MAVERKNLLSKSITLQLLSVAVAFAQFICLLCLDMTKLSVKSLIESSLAAGHTLDSDHKPLQQFFVIIEEVLKHGLKGGL